MGIWRQGNNMDTRRSNGVRMVSSSASRGIKWVGILIFLSGIILWIINVYVKPELESLQSLENPVIDHHSSDGDELLFNSKLIFDAKAFKMVENFANDYAAFWDVRVPAKECSMTSCFNFTNCKNGNFKLFLYPESGPANPFYSAIRSALNSSGYAVFDPEKACVFILGIDTLNRDILSPSYVKDVQMLMTRDPLIQRFWNGGRNHLIFNMYSGSYPYYFENDLGFDVGYAILAKTSASSTNFRTNFDISLPLFHDTLPARSEDALFPGIIASKKYPSMGKKYLMSFKGKRYLYGIGSDTRNSLYHIDNDRDILILTTCNHGGDAVKKLRDERCDQDDFRYNQNDYEDLLNNSSFCLVPRGRRLGSFRFLESLKSGCIPVILSNNWELPFSEIIDWKRATISVDERLLTQLPSMIRGVSFDQVLAMRQQSLLLYRQYFSSIERIVHTTLEILRNRLGIIRRTKEQWNSWPAISMTHIPNLEYSDYHEGFLKNIPNPRVYQRQNFTVVVKLSVQSHFGSFFLHVLKELNRPGSSGEKVLIFSPWKDATEQMLNRWKLSKINIVVLETPVDNQIFKQLLRENIRTEAVITIKDDCLFTWEEFEFGFQVWKSFPDRIVGYETASHFWDEVKSTWQYSSKLSNDYSMVLLTGSFVHVQYYWLLLHYQTTVLPQLHANCSDILLNFIVTKINRFPPVGLGRRPSPGTKTGDLEERLLYMVDRHKCLNDIVSSFGSMALVRSSVVYHPVLFKDPVSRYRKKYRKLEE